ncbi:MAG TPA: serine/threonine-protein kinase [Myxococcales bacterium]|jgi:serine/threonine protein kinase|nr:serine/threonine-protein kinase [Myxococcales bacterium]
MADKAASKSQPPVQKKRAVQRCPNCDIRCDVSLFVDGSLARCGHCGVRFEVHREKTPPPAVPPPPRAPPGPFPQLDGFCVLERIGQGGMGEVFRCTRNSDRLPVAVKILTPQMAAVPDYVRRFGREAAAMAQLDHPGIVRLLGRGKAGQHVYIAMELIEGQSLRMWAHANRPTAGQLARLLSQVAHALAYAHARAVVHRDLKPDNVLVTKDLKTKVLDFGLAGLHAEGAECLTQSHVAMGTANYMAPEQRKDAKRADHKADIYSFGVMMYELLTAELPVGKYPTPSKAVAGLDPRWDALIERCLEQSPAARPHSSLELAHALEAIAGIAAPTQVAPRTKKNVAKSGVWSWLGLGTAVAVIFGVVSLRMAMDHKAPRPQAAATRAVPKRLARR